MQIVYISNRPEVAAGTLEYVEALMPFLDEAIFVCPGAQSESFRRPAGRLAVSVVAEEQLLGDRLARFEASGDHQIRNWLLRSSLPSLDVLGAEFLMSDDDSRPLFEVPLELFVEAGRHNAFCTYELSDWKAWETDYDAGQHRTREILGARGFPTRSYSAHMPQVVDKALLAEVAENFAEESERGRAIDEWSAYFNAARTLHPERFHPPRQYQTLCWPALPTDWEAGVRPATFSFENCYPALYETGGLFEGIPQRFDPRSFQQHSEEKIRRRCRLQAVYDSRTAKLLRKAAWALRKGALAADGRLARSRVLPTPVRRLLRRAALHGDSPAWSFPWFLARYPRRAPPIN